LYGAGAGGGAFGDRRLGKVLPNNVGEFTNDITDADRLAIERWLVFDGDEASIRAAFPTLPEPQIQNILRINQPMSSVQ